MFKIILLSLFAAQAADDRCALLGEAAATLMEARQSGIPQSALRSAIEAQFSDPEQLEAALAMTSDAYDQRLRVSAASRELAVRRFRDEYENLCYSWD